MTELYHEVDPDGDLMLILSSSSLVANGESYKAENVDGIDRAG